MKPNSRGFTLIELMITITVAAILLGVGIPTFREFTRNNAVTAAHNDLVTSFGYARSEALRRSRPVSVCASADGATCGDAADWTTGWIAFTDRSTAGTLDGTDELLQVWQRSNDFLEYNSGGNSFVQYDSTGMALSAVSIELKYSGCTGEKGRRTNVLATGAVVAERFTC